MRRLTETYREERFVLRPIDPRRTYFEREYLPGIATDKLPLDRYARPGYALKLAELIRASRSREHHRRSFVRQRAIRLLMTETRSCANGTTGHHPESACRRPQRCISPNIANRWQRSRRVRSGSPMPWSRCTFQCPGIRGSAWPRFRSFFLHTHCDYRKRRRAGSEHLVRAIVASIDTGGSFDLSVGNASCAASSKQMSMNCSRPFVQDVRVLNPKLHPRAAS